MSGQFGLMKKKRFFPFFLTQFFGALNDNAYKNALVILVGFNAAQWGGVSLSTLSNTAAALFILPYFLFSATAGQLADKYEKSRLIRLTKILEIIVVMVAVVGFYTHSLPCLLSALFLLGAQSSLFGPVKYAILPQHLKEEELIGGNALIEAGTFLAILLGTIIGGALASLGKNQDIWICVFIGLVAIAGYLSSLGIPVAPSAIPALKINWNPMTQTWQTLKIAHKHRTVFISIIAISWFWFYGATFLSQFPEYTKVVLQGNERVVTLLLAAFSVGIGLGSFLCERLSGRQVEIGLVPLGAIGMTVFAMDIASVSPIAAPNGKWRIVSFLSQWNHIHIFMDLVFMGLFCGLYLVPLYALMQTRSPLQSRAQIIACNNIMNSIFMVASASIAVGLLALGLSISQIFFLVGLVNLLVVAAVFYTMPEFIFRFFGWILVCAVYRLERKGFDNLTPDRGGVFISNRISQMDMFLIAVASPNTTRFVFAGNAPKAWWMKWMFQACGNLELANKPPTDAQLVQIKAALAAGEWVCFFPELNTHECNKTAMFSEHIQNAIHTCSEGMQVVSLYLSHLRKKAHPASVSLGTKWGRRMAYLDVCAHWQTFPHVGLVEVAKTWQCAD